jgi:hypothetical protein
MDSQKTTAELIAFLIEQDARPAMGWFNCLPNNYAFEPNDYEEWNELCLRFETQSPGLDRQLIPLVEKHVWEIGRMGLSLLAERVWGDLSRAARGNYLAGISHDVNDDTYPDFVAKTAEADFSPTALCEVGVHLLAFQKREFVMSLLGNPETRTSEIERFVAFRGRVLGQKYKQLDALSRRVVDILLEAALRFTMVEVVDDLLKRGASPDINLWQLFSSSSERYCALSYAIANELHDCIPMLLEAGADPSGSEFSGRGLPLLMALNEHNWAIADMLLQRGARFVGEKHNSLKVYSYPSDETLDWIRKIAGKKLRLEPIDIKPQCYIPNGIFGTSHTFLTAIMSARENIEKYVPLGLDARLTAEELGFGIEVGAVSSLEYLLDLAKVPESLKKQVLAKAQSYADKPEE